MSERSSQWSIIDPKTKLELRYLDHEFRARRRRVFENHLARTVRLASPLLIDACTKEELDDAICRIRPSAGWPDGRLPRVTVRGWSAKSRRHDRARTSVLNRLTGESFSTMDQLHLHVCHHTVHMMFRVGSISILTAGDGGYLSLPHRPGEHVLPNLVGANLDYAVELPMVSDRPYRIMTVKRQRDRATTLIQFEAAPLEWSVPWARPWDVPF